ncbi:hypothetical protein [Skermania piniformis]|uniref:Lipoprotein n=1 Tax=Skermania pinensis TaxID=39122 RepID=A0ABX8SAX0_9ACTN|nr:hypothetical protein [Skermania piniformis]QXQ15008.1 hypothetical protein KV203_06530 [Skermania piniformis]
MRYTTVAMVAAALLLAGCGSSDDASPDTAGGPSSGDLNASISAAASALPDDATDADVRAAGFAVAFRAGFADLAAGRSDAELRSVYAGTCTDIKTGASEADIRRGLTERLRNGAVAPTEDQIGVIYSSIKVIC